VNVIEYLIGGMIGWFIGGGMGAVIMSLLIVASKADDEMELIYQQIDKIDEEE
jgi:uncharacterized membrane protein